MAEPEAPQARTLGNSRLQRVRQALARARDPRHYRQAVWVALGSGVFAFGLGLCAWSAFDFTFRDPFEIVSRITLAQYPKQQDIFGYGIAIFSVIAGVTAGWFGWCTVAGLRVRDTNEATDANAEPNAPTRPATDAAAETRALDAKLSRWAWPFALLGVAVLPIASARWGAGELVLLPLAAAGLAALWARLPATGSRAGQPALARTGTPYPRTRTGTAWPPLPTQLGFQSFFLAVCLPLLLYAWLYDGYLIHHRIDMHHEGEILAPWSAFLDGAVPFRDIYLQHGLFQNLGKGWLAGELFGVSVASLRTIEHLLGPFGQLALYFLALVFLRSWLSGIVLILVTSSANLWAVDRQALGLVAVAALAYGVRSGQLASTPASGAWHSGLWAARNAALSGVATTLAFFYSADVGIFTAASCGAFLLIRLLFDRRLRGPQRWLPLLVYLGGAGICFLPFAVALASAGALDDLWRNTARQIAYQSTVWGRPYPPLVATLSSVTDLRSAAEAITGKWFQWYLPPIVYLFAVGHLSLRALRGRLWRRPDSGALLLLLLTALISFASSLSRADSFHLKFGTLPMWLFVGLALEAVLADGWRAFRGATGAAKLSAALWPALVCAAIGGYLVAVHDPIGKASARVEEIASGRYWPRLVHPRWARLGGIRIGDDEFEKLQQVVAYVQRHVAPGQTIFDFSSQPTYYFLTERPNPTRYSLAAYAATPEMQREVIADLERRATALVIFRSGGYLDRLDRVPFAKRSPLIHAYLRENYEEATRIGGTIILARRNAPDRESSSQ